MQNGNMELFIRVVQAGSFSNVAKKDGVSTNAIIKKINRLEEELEIKLLIRSTHGITTTEAGELIYNESVRMLSEIKAIWIKAKEISSSENKTVRIGTSIMRPCNEIIEKWNRLSNDSYYNIRIVPFIDDNDNFETLMDEIGTNIDIIATVYDKNRIKDKCKSLKIRDEIFGAIVPVGHPFSNLKEIDIVDIVKEKLIMVYEGGNREQDRIRKMIKVLNPNADIMEVPHYDVETINMCQSFNRIIIATRMTQHNAIQPFVNVKWNYKNSYGLLYPKKTNEAVKHFVKCIENSLLKKNKYHKVLD